MRLFRFAVACAAATFVLTIFGGLVSATESGLACPDWPLCEGRFIPPMINGKQFEHTHRLVASFVMVMTFGLAALLAKYRAKDRLLVKLGYVACGLVIAQALLGALTVVLRLPWEVSTAHLGIANLFFALMVSLAFLAHPRTLLPSGEGGRRPDEGTSTVDPAVARAVLPIAGLVYLQVVAGGVMRHMRAGLACGFDLPYCNGALWPMSGGAPLQMHLVHRFLGVVVGLAVLWLAFRVQRSNARLAAKVLAGVAAVAVVFQVTLGVMTVTLSRELFTMSLHSSLGMLLLASVVSLYWLTAPSPLGTPWREAPGVGTSPEINSGTPEAA